MMDEIYETVREALNLILEDTAIEEKALTDRIINDMKPFNLNVKISPEKLCIAIQMTEQPRLHDLTCKI